MKRRDAITQIAAAAATVALPAWSAPNNRIVLGQSAAFSGPASALGEQFRQGAALHFNRVNTRGGISGRMIELQSLDDGYEPDRCAANTSKLIDSGVFALFGYVGTPTSLAALPLVHAAKIPFIAPFTGAEALRTPFNRSLFHVRASYFDETAEIVKQVVSMGVRRMGVFYQNDSLGKTGLEGITNALKPHRLTPTGLGTVERNTVEVDAAVRSILNSNPDVIIQISAYKSCAAFIRAARKAGFRGTFYNISFVGTQALAQELGSDAHGVVVSQVMPVPFTPLTPLTSEYLAAGKALLGEKFQPNYGSMEGFVAAKTLTEGLRRMGNNFTHDDLIAGLESLHDFNLGGFYIDFNATKHTGSKFVELVILTSDGRVRR